MVFGGELWAAASCNEYEIISNLACAGIFRHNLPPVAVLHFMVMRCADSLQILEAASCWPLAEASHNSYRNADREERAI